MWGGVFYASRKPPDRWIKDHIKLLKGKSMKEKLAGGSALVSALAYVFC
jgi:hypothetical protein